MLMNIARRALHASGQLFGRPGGRGQRHDWTESYQPLETRMVFDAADVAPDNHTLVRFDTNFGAIVIELFDNDAPITVTNFVNYVSSNKLNETFFHRMVRKTDGGIDILQGGTYYMREGQTGAPPQVDTGAPIVLEPPSQTGHSNVAGSIAMARTTDPNSATSGFFFNVTDNTSLDTNGGGYAVFGQVVNGMDVLQVMFSQDRVNAGGAFTDLPVTDHLADDATTLTPADVLMVNRASVIDRTATRTTPGSTVTGSANVADVTFIASIGAGGASQVFTQDGEDLWAYTNLSTATGAPQVTGNLVTFFDPRTGLKSAVGPSAQGVILFSQASDQSWTFRNLTTTTNGAVVTGKVTAFISTDAVAHVAGMTEDGRLVLYNGFGTAWEFRDLTSQDLEVRGLETPAFVGDITSYVTAWNGLNIVGLDDNGQIQVVWWSPGIDQDLWTSSNLSQITGAPTLTGGLTVYLTSWQATNIVGITEDGHVSVTWWLPTFGGHWNKDDLTFQTGGPNLLASTITSYVTAWGATNVAGLDADGKLWVYWWTPDFGTTTGWQFNDLIAALPAGTKPMVGQITGVTSNGPTINLVGSAANGDVMRFSWSAADTLGWLGEDVSYLASIS